MAQILVGYDVAQNARRQRVRRAIERQLPARQESALQGEIAESAVAPLLQQLMDLYDPAEDGLVVAHGFAVEWQCGLALMDFAVRPNLLVLS